MFQLHPFAQNYAWGKRGNDSLVGSLMNVDESKREVPYAELWMGTHPSGPSKILETNELLLSWLQKNPRAIGTVPSGYSGNDLPFLFKVLSIQNALSIQAHPDKTLAGKLHQERPSIYKDANHKPEMVIALTEFRCMCSFRAIEEIVDLSSQFPEFTMLLSESGFDARTVQDNYLPVLFRRYMTSDDRRVKELLAVLVNRLREKNTPLSVVEDTILLLYDQFPGDIGVFAPILLNCFTLQPGESFFIGANEPHAYISGDCVECMALSDNVVRAGLTDKLKDVETLCGMLSYRAGLPHFVRPVQLDESASLYHPPYHLCSEFAVEKIEVTPGRSYTLLNRDISSILFVLEGTVSVRANDVTLQLRRGGILFIAAGESIQIENLDNSNSVVFRSHVNVDSDR